MKRLAFLAMVFLAVPYPASAAGRPKAVAVVDFENVTKDKSLDWLGTGIAETLVTDLGNVPGVELVERSRLQSVLKELKFGHSEYVDFSTAKKLGKIVGADYMVVGGYQKLQDDLRLTARLVEVGTGKILLPSQVDGKYKDLFSLEDQLAGLLRKAVGVNLGEEEATPFAGASSSLEALHRFSDGVNYFRDGLDKEALENLDAALKLDSRFSLANYYKGLVLEKENHWGDALQSFKQALLGSEEVKREAWKWEPPFEQARSKRLVWAVREENEQKVQEGAEKQEGKKKEKEEKEDLNLFSKVHRLIFLEKVGKTAVLYITDPRLHTTKRMVLPDASVFEGFSWVVGSENVAVISAFQQSALGDREGAGEWHLYGVDLDKATLRWSSHVPETRYPDMWDFYQGTLILYWEPGTLYLVEGSTGRGSNLNLGRLVDSPEFSLDSGDPKLGRLILAIYPGKGGFAVLRGDSGQKLWGIKGEASDWTVRTFAQSFPTGDEWYVDRVLVMDTKADRVVGYRAATGEKVFELSVPLESSLREGVSYKWVVYAKEKSGWSASHLEDTLYVACRPKAVCALDVGYRPRNPTRVLWRTSVGDTPSNIVVFRDRLYVASKKGEVITLKRATGRVEARTKLRGENIHPVYVRGNLALLRTDDGYLGLDLQTLETKWEYKTHAEGFWRGSCLQGMLVFQTGKKEVTALDISSGEVLWRHLGNRLPTIIPGVNSVFVADETGVQEYVSPKSATQPSLLKAEVMTQMALSLLESRQPDEAASLAQKVVHELDPDYPGAHEVLAGIYRQKNDTKGALRETLAYYQLLGPESDRAREVFQDLKRNFYLHWRTDTEIPRLSDAADLGNQVILSDWEGRSSALNLQAGDIDWRQDVEEHFKGSTISRDSQILYSVTGQSEESTGLQVWQVAAETGERKLLGTLDSPFRVQGLGLQPAAARLFLLSAGVEQSSGVQLWRLMSVDTGSGKLQWERSGRLESGEYVSGLVADANHVFYSAGTTLHVLSASDGKDVAQPDVGGFTDLIESLVCPGKTFYVMANRRLGSYEVGSNRVNWLFNLPEGQSWVPLGKDYLRGSTFYFSSGDEVLAVDLSDKEGLKDRVRWRLSMAKGTTAEHLRVVGDRVYCLRDDETLLQVDADSGRVISEFPVLWDAEQFFVKGDEFYGITSDGQAYSMKLAPLTDGPATQAQK